MTGGRAALWKDEDMADLFTRKAVAFIEQNRARPFFLYFATHDLHVPRVPHPRFAGTSGMGPRGDALLEGDWSVGQILGTLDRLKLTNNTLVIFTSDNGPVVDDGYRDEAVEKLGGHTPAGPLRGGKGSNFEGGTRVPFVVRWPAAIKPGVSAALVSQIDLLASFASFTGQALTDADAPDSADVLSALLGKSKTGRQHLVQQATVLSLRMGTWKYIEPSSGPKVTANTDIETGNDPGGQLYDLSRDLGERNNLALKHPERMRDMAARLATIRETGRTRR
jgi:arylsulfatase A-like enzyme